MSAFFRRLLGVVGIGASWAVCFGFTFLVLASVIGFFRPQDLGPGETPAIFMAIGLLVGFVSGSIFGVILALAEHRKAARDLALIRVALWGAMAGSAWPLLTPVDNSMILVLGPLGMLCATALVTAARRLGAPRAMLRAACASNGA